MVEAGRHHSVQSPGLGRVSQSRMSRTVPRVLSVSTDGEQAASLGNQIQCLTTLTLKNAMFTCVQVEFPVFQFVLLPLVPLK